LQRRLKAWRREMAQNLVLGSFSDPAQRADAPAPDAHNAAIVLAAVKMLWGGSEGTYPSLH